jgi:hypothetical protein
MDLVNVRGSMHFTGVPLGAHAGAGRHARLEAGGDPGAYTMQVSGMGGTTGVALAEIYEVP